MSAILLKDLRESSFPIMVVVVLGLVYLGYRLARAMTYGLAITEAWADFVVYALTPCAILVAQRLVQREVQHGWPLLRQHPVRLGRLFVAKLVLGALLVGLPLAIGALLNAGAGSVLAFGGPNTYDPLPRGCLVYLALVGALAVLVSVLGRHAWTTGVGLWVLLPYVGATSSSHPRQLIEARFVDPGSYVGYAVAAGILVVAGVAFAGFGGRGPAAWRGRWGWTDRGAFAAVALIALGGAPTPTPEPPLRGDVIEIDTLCVRDLRHAPQASARIAELASNTLTWLPASLTPPTIAIEHGGSDRLEISPSTPLLLARVDFLSELDTDAFQRDLLHGVLERVGEAGYGWAFLRDGYPGYALAAGNLEAFPRSALNRASLAAATLVEAKLFEGPWLERWEGPVRRRVGDSVARDLAAWLLLRAEPDQLGALIERWGEPLAGVWGAGGFGSDLAGFQAASRSLAEATSRDVLEAAPLPTLGDWTFDDQRRVVLTPKPADGITYVVYTAPCTDERQVPRVFERVEGPSSLDPWRAGPFPTGKRWLGFAERRGNVERFGGWQIVQVP